MFDILMMSLQSGAITVVASTALPDPLSVELLTQICRDIATSMNLMAQTKNIPVLFACDLGNKV